jgi:hypothetical protein
MLEESMLLYISYCDMTPETIRRRLGELILVEANVPNNRRSVFSAIRAARVATQRCGKHISAAMNQHATIEE